MRTQYCIHAVEKIDPVYIIGTAEHQKAFHILNTIINQTQGFKVSLKLRLNLSKI